MVALMQARRSKNKHKSSEAASLGKSMTEASGERNLESLVESVKRKTAAIQQPGLGKRRKL